MSACLLTHPLDGLPESDREALSHHAFISSSWTTAEIVRLLAKDPFASEFMLPEEDVVSEQFFVAEVRAKSVRAALNEIGFRTPQKLDHLLDAAERHGFMITVDHKILNGDGGAITRSLSYEEIYG